MKDSERVQRWRQRQREAGKKPRTIWLTDEEDLRLEDMALTRRCSPSELVQHALALLRGEALPVTAPVTDTEQIRAIVQHELARTQPVAGTSTDTLTVTLGQMLPGLVRALLQEQQPASVPATVTDTVTDTSTSPMDDHRPEAAPERVSDTVPAPVVVPMTYPATVPVPATVVVPMTYPVTATGADTAMAPMAKRKAPPRQRPVTATVSDTVTVTGQAVEPFDTSKYVLGKLCPRGHAWGSTGQSLLRRTNRHCCACDREKFQERGKVQRQARKQARRQQEGKAPAPQAG